jgi:cell fate (sporulation/competence/biofilm development) regulator YlbF (YheA/YmcA/DUF963 family)
MATTQEILDKATELGKKIAGHDSARKLEDAMSKLHDDLDAQRLLSDYQRHLQTLGEKEARQQPIEVEDKHKLEDLQGKVIRNTVLRDLQMAQMDYLDLMRRVDEAMTGHIEDGGAAQGQAATSPLVNPDITG